MEKISSLVKTSQVTTETDSQRLHGQVLCPNQNKNLHCPHGWILNIIQADYGRKHQFLCGHGKVKNCTTKSSTTAKVKEICDGKRVCHIDAKEGRFEDACPGVIKYLHVVYTCIHGVERSNNG